MSARVSPALQAPFNRAWTAPRALDYVRESLASGQTAGDGVFTRSCQEWLRCRHGCAAALLTPSCTAALEMAALLAEAGPGTEVIVPSFTFVSTASAFALFGARLVFADIRADTLTLDEGQVQALATPRTRAVATVHYAGAGPDPAGLAAWCRERGIVLVEDAAHALGGSFGGRPFGAFGDLATLSFHESKNFSCGEGGALLVNNPAYAARAEILREKGTNRSAFLRREVAKYTWVDLGSSYLMSDLCAAVLLAQLEQFEFVQSRRLALWDRYQRSLRSWARRRDIRQPHIAPGCAHAGHLYHLVTPEAGMREALLRWLGSRGVEAYFHYLPLHRSAAGARLGSAPLGAPVTEQISARLLRLPLYPDLDDGAQERIIETLLAFPG